MTDAAPGDSVRLCDSCGWHGDPNMTPPPEGGTCPVCGEGEMARYVRASEGEVLVPRTHVAALADYAHQFAGETGIDLPDDVWAAVEWADDTLGHEREEREATP